MSMRIRTALVIMLIFLVVTTANYFSSVMFTANSITDTMEQELILALDIADTLVASNIGLLKSNAETVAERLLKCDAPEDMQNVMASQSEEFADFTAFTVYDRNGVIAHNGDEIACDISRADSDYVKAAFNGLKILSSPHINITNDKLVMHVFVPMDKDMVLSATIQGMYFADLLSQYRLWHSGSIFIVDAEGTFVANYRYDLVTNRRNFIDDALTDAAFKSAGDFYKGMISSPGRGSGKYVYEGEERLCVYKPVTDSLVGWRTGVVAPLSEGPHADVKYSLRSAALLFLGVGVIISVIASGFASKPFRKIETQNRNLENLMETARLRGDLLDTGNNTAKILLSIEDEKDIEAPLMDSMALIGRSADADRVQIWRNETIDGSLYFVHTYEWLSDVGRQKTPVPIGLKFPYSEKPEWERKFMRGESINGPVSELSPDDRDFLGAYDMQTIVIIPLFLQDQFWGFFSLDDCRRERTFSEEEIRILHSVSLMMANAFNHAAQALKIREAHEYTELIIEAMPFACTLWDSDVNLFGCNEGTVRMFGLESKDEFLGHFEDFSPEYQQDGDLSSEKSVREIKKAFAEGVNVQEWMHQKRDGTPIPTEVSLVRVTNGSEYIVAAYVRDLREQKRMMAEIDEMMVNLQSASRAKSDFLAKMSHEMRTPLNAILGLSELALEDNRVMEETRLCIERVNNAGMTLLVTVNDILDISKIEAGKLELNPVKYDLPSLLNDTVTQSMMFIEDKPITFALDIEEDLLVQLYGDDLRIRQILNNLLSNAFKYTSEGTVELGVRCMREGEETVWLTAWVRDTGRGIRQEHLEMLFDEFVKLDEQANRQIMGTGLGLPITRRMAELMDGSVTVESEYGKGSVFTVRIRQTFVSEAVIGPKVVENLRDFRYTDQKRRSNSEFVRIKLPYARVLVVDDTQTNLDVARGLMKPYEMQIDCVTSGQMAIDAIRDENVVYSAILMDHMMPGMDGIEAARRIREIGTEYARNIPIIACTANAIVGSNEMFLENGFQAFISKPINVIRLDEIIRYWIRDKRQETFYYEREHRSGGEGGGIGAERGDERRGEGDERRGGSDGERSNGADRWADARRSGSDSERGDGDGERSNGERSDGVDRWADARRSGERRSGVNRRSDFDRRTLGDLADEIDVRRGVGRFGGDKDVYFEILRSFAVNTKPLLDAVQAVSIGNLDDYATTVHGIKGSSRGIFAETVGNLAEALEKAARRGDQEFINEHNRAFISTVEKLISDLESFLDKQGDAAVTAAKPSKDKPDEKTLLKLFEACVNYSMDMFYEAMTEINGFTYTSDDGLVAWINETAAHFDYSKIAKKLTALLMQD